MLKFQDVYYTYPDGQCVLKGLSLHVPLGKKCALIGHNGCGKTTLFLHANGLLIPDSGEVYWKGKKIDYKQKTLQKWRQEVGIVFQNPEHQLIAPTITEELAFGLHNLRVEKSVINQLLQETMDDFSLHKWRDKPIHHLSLGQKKWLSLASVMIMKPSLLILDEPTAYLDRLQVERFMEKLNDIHQKGVTVFMATHDLDLVFQWADVVFVMHDGQIVMQGKPEEVFVQGERLKQFQIGVPLLAAVWNTLFPNERRIPRSIEEIKARMKV
ncbi:energy-coupling factor ABC transporter ATP-binding protein [Thermaerobacillus caldiproteolyticus]|uniref:Cobalt/nickel transport system ATP-binding protein n=1 Tax=Thermaerobacillus caldiproteolyticus TaxID=247480 RepID=A0A7V9Z8B5_9BACL|nr:ABC transporter ATP-binding protein [Anoxybacillus caldiproteolyticus]MBA2875917.1 cobalt/nickel transport system ATP-binding protein [Anoxybacillus caldiproteolyticus]QPA32440.1 ABC transporter ATP-binding protein [Anoxybacillus caldiproteolyticus]